MTEFLDRTFSDRVLRQIRVSITGHPSTNAIARGLHMAADKLRPLLIDLAAQGVIVPVDGGWRIPE